MTTPAQGFGPIGPRAALVRPNADPDTYAGAPTWFKDCSGPGAADGTVPDASWFNMITGNLRYAASQAAVTVGNDQSAAQDGALWAIIQAAISQRLGVSGSSGAWNLI